MTTWLLIGIAGAAGAITRHAVGLAVGPQSFPYATLVVNLTGSFLLGLTLAVGADGRLSAQSTTAIAVGFLGAYTTYSTFAFEAFTLGRLDRAATAVLYVALSVSGGLLAAALGYRLGSR